MSDQKWTPEPWVCNGPEIRAPESDCVENLYDIGFVLGAGHPQQFPNANRIVACVNALAGIADPAAFVKRAKAIEEAARRAQDQLEYMRVLSVEDGEFYPNSGGECATRVAELAAALAMPGGAQ